jgi:hypothetical protein
MNTVPKEDLTKEFRAIRAKRKAAVMRERQAAITREKEVAMRAPTAHEIERARRRTLPVCAPCSVEHCTAWVSPRFGSDICADHGNARY